MAKLSFQIDGMHCGACVRRVTQALNGLPETHADEVRVGSAQVSTAAPAAEVLRALAAIGFPARIAS